MVPPPLRPSIRPPSTGQLAQIEIWYSNLSVMDASRKLCAPVACGPAQDRHASRRRGGPFAERRMAVARVGALWAESGLTAFQRRAGKADLQCGAFLTRKLVTRDGPSDNDRKPCTWGRILTANKESDPREHGRRRRPAALVQRACDCRARPSISETCRCRIPLYVAT